MTIAALSCRCPAHASIFISGLVLATAPTAPAAGVTVALYPVTPDQDPETDSPADVSQTLRNGTFVLKAPAPGRYGIRVESAFYEPYAQQLNVPKRGPTAQAIRIVRRPAVRIRLVAPGGAPVRGAPAEAWVSFAPGPGQRAGGGRFGGRRFTGMRAREVRFAVDEAVSADGELDIVLPEGFSAPAGVTIGARVPGSGVGQAPFDHLPQQPVVIHLEHGSTLLGVVLDQDGNPLPGIQVTVMPASANGMGRFRAGLPQALTGHDGRFELPSLLPDEYLVRARAADGSQFFDSVELTEPSSSIILRPAGD